MFDAATLLARDDWQERTEAELRAAGAAAPTLAVDDPLTCTGIAATRRRKKGRKIMETRKKLSGIREKVR